MEERALLRLPQLLPCLGGKEEAVTVLLRGLESHVPMEGRSQEPHVSDSAAGELR